jgi:hypothetical protein
MGGGLALRALNAGVKVAKAVDKANNIVETAQAAVETTENVVLAVQEGDGRGLIRTVGGALLDAATDKAMGKKMRAGVDVPKKTHGNKLDDKPAEGYTLEDRDDGTVKKYGETTRGEDAFGEGEQKRYSKKELKEKNVDYVKQESGTKKEMHRWQHEKIVEHKEKNGGKRPDLNKSDY